jgi:hypothetical protein
MKTTKTILALAISTLLVPLASAQEVIRDAAPPAAPAVPSDAVASTTVQPIEAAGTIAEFGNNSITVRSETSASPIHYRYSDTTQWVDEDGNVVSRETVRTGVPVTIQYTQAVEGSLVTKVVVRKRSAPATVTPPPVDPQLAPKVVESHDPGAGRPAPQTTERRETVVERPAAKVNERRETVIERPAPKVIERREAVVEEKPAPKVIERRQPVVIERPAPKVIERPAPTVIERPPVIEEKKTTTTTTEKKKSDNDEDDDD